jgi:hypothetical protein
MFMLRRLIMSLITRITLFVYIMSMSIVQTFVIEFSSEVGNSPIAKHLVRLSNRVQSYLLKLLGP